MSQHHPSRLHVLLLGVALTLLPSGCWWFGQQGPGDPAVFTRWGIHRLGVVTFSDLTGQSLGERAAAAHRRAWGSHFGREWVETGSLQSPPSQPPAFGLIGVGQAQTLGRLNRVDGLLTGQVLAFQYQPRSGRVWISVSLRLLDAARGSIIWSRTATAAPPLTRPADSDAAADDALSIAAKEFLDVLLGSPS